MTQICRAAKCIEAIRVTLLDQCTLLPVPGPLNAYVMGCIIDPDWNPEIEEGEESTVKDNCQSICLRDDACDLTKRWNIEFKIKDPDKEFLALIEGNPLIVSGGVSIGVRQLAYGACSPYVFLEMFERTGDCTVTGDPVYYRHVFPAVRLRWTGNEREGIFRILQIEGKTKDVLTDNIGTGPFDDIPAGVLVGASASERIDYAWFEDGFLPVLQCGAIEVPVGPAEFGFTITGEGVPFGQRGGVDVAVDSLGRYLVAAQVDDGLGFTTAGIWRFEADGDIDLAFGTAGLFRVPTSPTVNMPAGIAVDLADDSVYMSYTYDLAGAKAVTVVKVDSAGVPVPAWDIDGFVTVVAANVQAAPHGLAIESDGRIAVAWNNDVSGFGFIDRLNVTGGTIGPDQVTFTQRIQGMARYNADGVYAVGLTNFVAPRVGIGTLGTGVVEAPTGGDISITIANSNFGVAVTPGGDIYLSGSSSATGMALVAKFDPLLVADATFGTGGQVEVTDGGWTSAGFESVNVIGGGDLILGGYYTGVANDWMTVRMDSAGVLDAGYGTAGIQSYVIPDDNNAMLIDSIIDGIYAVHTGYSFQSGPATSATVIARTLLTTGALDPTFGTP